MVYKLLILANKITPYFIINKNLRKKIKEKFMFKTSKNLNIIEFTNRANSMGKNIGKCSYLGTNCYVYHPKTTIGSFTSIAHNVTIGAGQHPYNWLTTSPFAWDVSNNGGGQHYEGFLDHLDRNLYKWESYKPCYIGNDCWIGMNVVIMDGIVIGDGAIVGANAVVTKDVKPYEIVAGVPAKVIKKRFDDETIKKLIKLKWWNSDDEILKYLPYNNVSECIKLLERGKNE